MSVIFFLVECIQKFPDGKVRHWSQHNNEADCKADQGEWVEFTNYLEEAPGSIKSKTECENNKGNANGIKYIWGRPYGSDTKKCLIALDAPECYEAPWTRVNHLGNGKDGKPVSHKWVIPYFPSMKKQRCVLRIR